jgi:hypothetical protein
VSEDIKAVFNPATGQTDNYFGGQEGADGKGHGHIRADEQGNLSIIRGTFTPGEPFARRNATELDSRGFIEPGGQV